MSRVLASRLALALALGLAAPARAATVKVTGVVVDRAGRPVEYATVTCPTHRTGASTDEQGGFTIELPEGPARLEFGQLGYEHVRIELVVAPGLEPLRVTLAEQPVPLAEVQVAASAFGRTGGAEGATLRRRDVVMTPGGAADVFQALRALPGLNAPNEGAAIYVRGGDPSETLIRLDGDEIGHPYHYEGASGGVFSTLDNYLVRGASFSSGGFPARYGGVLSGVLDVETIDPGDLRTVNAGINMVGANLSSTWALVPGRLSATGSLRYSDTGLLMRVYGSSQDYEESPVSDDAVLKLRWRLTPTLRLSAVHMENGDRTAVHANTLNVESVYDENTRNRFTALQLEGAVLPALALHANAALQRYRTEWTFSGFGTAREERAEQANLDAVWSAGPRHQVSFGANLRRRATRVTGTAPADSVDLAEGAPQRARDVDATLEAPGVYAEDKLRVWGPLYATLGLRVDRQSSARDWTVDPRAALAWRMDDRQTLRVAGGRYHQPPDPGRLDRVYGNPRLGPLAATHLIAGYEFLDSDTDVRVEAYRKDYRDLVTVDSLTWFANRGRGYARGIDVLVKGGHRWLTGWVSYGFLDTRRREGDDPRELPSPYGVRHSLTVVADWQMTSAWMLGVRQGWSTGHPWTPVVGRVWDPSRSIWRPVFGENDSALMPDYHRLDVRLTHLFSLPRALGLPASAPCAAYVEGLNVLGTRNVLEYVWNSDWSRRYSRESYFSRAMLVLGVSLTW